MDESLQNYIETNILPLYDDFEKYAKGGYLRLWFENSPKVARLNALREIIKDEPLLHEKFDYLYDVLTLIAL